MNKKFQIRFERTGGFTGIPIDVVIDSEKLKDEERDKIISLLDVSYIRNYKKIDPAISHNTMPDKFTYRIALETENDSLDLIVSEINITDEIRPLITILGEISRRLMLS